MGFKLQRVNRDGNESALEIINSDYHNGNCIFYPAIVRVGSCNGGFEIFGR